MKNNMILKTNVEVAGNMPPEKGQWCQNGFFLVGLIAVSFLLQYLKEFVKNVCQSLFYVI